MRVVSKIFTPHSILQKDIMTFLAGKGPPYTLWVACGTKFGKTMAASGSVAYGLPKFRSSMFRIVAPIYRQTKISWKYVSKMWPGEPYVRKNISEMTMRLPGLDNELQFWHGKNPEDLEGEAVSGQVNDECAKLKKQIMDSSKTTMTRTQGRMLNLSTPRGKNWFFNGCMRAKKMMEEASKNGTIPREIFLSAPTSANPYIPRESIEEAKRVLPERLFRQYYLAEFVDDGEVLPRPIIDPMWLAPYEKEGIFESWVHPDASNISVVAGCDWAKKKDYTVLTVWDHSKRPFKIVGFLRFNFIRYNDQVLHVVRFLRQYKNLDILYHDKTGLGEVIDDLLSCVPNLVYKGYTFSNVSKSYLANNLILGMEREETIYPWWPELLGEFEVFGVETNDLGNMFYSAPDGFHDDIVWSCALGYNACLDYSDNVFEVKFLEDLGMEKDYLQQYIEDSLDIDVEEGF